MKILFREELEDKVTDLVSSYLKYGKDLSGEEDNIHLDIDVQGEHGTKFMATMDIYPICHESD